MSPDDPTKAPPEPSSAVHVVTPVRSAGWWSLTKLGPIIAALIIGGATITASLINRSGRNNNATTTTSTTEVLPTSTRPVSSTSSIPVAFSTPPLTAPPQVIIVQVPASTLPGAPPQSVIVTVTVFVTIPATTTKPGARVGSTRPTTADATPAPDPSTTINQDIPTTLEGGVPSSLIPNSSLPSSSTAVSSTSTSTTSIP
jgi:hypothetical protein